MKLFINAALLTLMLVCSGCMLGPDFSTPVQSDMPEHFINTHTNATAEVNAKWWESFNDPVLIQLLKQGDESNLSLLQAVERITQSRMALIKTQAGLWPSLNASAGGSRTKTWSPDDTKTAYNAGIDASWELDIFGGVRRGAEAASAELEAVGMNLEDARISLAAEIAVTYFTLRTQQTSLEIAKSNLVIQIQSSQIARDKYEAGLTSALDLTSAEAQIENTRARIPSIEAAISTAMYQLELLLGLYPGDLNELLAAHAPIPASDTLPDSLPSDIIRRRPDIRRAEADLHAATARIGMAQADRFPSITIKASGTLSSDTLSSWSEVMRSVGINPSISLPIFSAGSRKAQVEQYKSAAKESMLAYRESVLSAISEVETALRNLEREQARGESLELSLRHTRNALSLATELYRSGEIEFLELLTHQQSLLTAEQSCAENKASVAEYAVKLFKAMGGGADL